MQAETDAALEELKNLEMQLASKHKLELEIEQLKGKLEVMKHIRVEEDTTLEIEKIRESLKEKDEELEHIDSINQTLIVKHRRTNDELEDAKKYLISVSIVLLAYIFVLSLSVNSCLRCRTYLRCQDLNPSSVLKEWVSLIRKLFFLHAKRKHQNGMMKTWHFYVQNGTTRSVNQNGILSRLSLLMNKKRCFIS